MKNLSIIERIREYSDWMVKHLSPKFTPSEQEQLLCDLIIRQLQSQKTNRIIWEQDYLLITDGTNIIRLDGYVLSVISASGTIKLHCSVEYVDYIKSKIIKHIEDDIATVEEDIRNKELEFLQHINL